MFRLSTCWMEMNVRLPLMLGLARSGENVHAHSLPADPTCHSISPDGPRPAHAGPRSRFCRMAVQVLQNRGPRFGFPRFRPQRQQWYFRGTYGSVLYNTNLYTWRQARPQPSPQTAKPGPRFHHTHYTQFESDLSLGNNPLSSGALGRGLVR